FNLAPVLSDIEVFGRPGISMFGPLLKISANAERSDLPLAINCGVLKGVPEFEGPTFGKSYSTPYWVSRSCGSTSCGKTSSWRLVKIRDRSRGVSKLTGGIGG